MDDEPCSELFWSLGNRVDPLYTSHGRPFQFLQSQMSAIRVSSLHNIQMLLDDGTRITIPLGNVATFYIIILSAHIPQNDTVYVACRE